METTRMDNPILSPDFTVSEEIREMRCGALTAPSAEQLAEDPKLAYLREKYGKE